MIFCGYKSDMAKFMQANDGLYRRISHTFDFSDYTPANLAEIFVVYSSKKGFKVEEVRIAVTHEQTERWSSAAVD